MAKTIPVSEIPIGVKLKQLFELQIIDSEVDQIKVLKGELPMVVSDLEDEISGLAVKVGKLQSSVTESEKEASAHKSNIKAAEDAIKKYEKQLDGVKNNREYDALTKEINLQRLEIQLSEKKMLTLDAIVEKQTTRQKDLEEKKTELDKIIEKTDKEETTLIAKSDKYRKKIEVRLLHAYDTIRKRYRNGLAVVMVKRSACGGCFNQIPPQVQLEIGLRKKIIACEHCGRVLVDDLIQEVEI